jgi:hypothetical protein
MQDILTRLHALQRPQTLMRAARMGADSYRRGTHLRRLLGCSTLPRSGPALIRLIEMEAELNVQRKMADTGYNLIRHIEVLIAIVSEARMLRTVQGRPDAT